MTDNLKPGWKIVKFDDIAQNIAERVSPVPEDSKQYIGLEHLDTDCLSIRRWGTDIDLKGQKLRMKKGDIIFGKRNVYLRRVAIAPFDGICSAHAMVLRPKLKEVEKDFLPFLMQSDTFMEKALKISVGSLSPTINWNTLKQQEFALPPRDEQRRIAEILWAADDAAKHFYASNTNVYQLKYTLITNFTTCGLNNVLPVKKTRLGCIPANWNVLPIGDLVSICQYGLSVPLYESGQYPILRMMNYEDGIIIPNNLKYVDLSDKDFDNFRVEYGDILFNRTNSADLVGKIGIFKLNGNYVFASYLVRLRAIEDKVFPDYLNYYLNSKLGQDRILAYATPGVSQTNINANNLKKVLVPLPPLEEQKEIVKVIQALDMQKTMVAAHFLKTQELKKAILSSLFR